MSRPKLTAVNHYSIFPFNHGGSLGIRGLYKALSEWFDVNIITFVMHDYHPDELAISNHVKVIPIVLPEKLTEIQKGMYEQYGMGADTLVDSSPTVIRWYHQFPEIIERVKRIAEDSIVVLAEHVYTWKIIKTACPDKHLWYRANNVEYDYKRTTWDKIGCPQELLQEVYDIEKECCEECERILAVSQLEIARFMELYNLPEKMKEKFVDIRSGYDTDNLQTIFPGKRERISEKYDNTGFFITSYTPYGQTAAENCIVVAKENPNLQIIIAGSIRQGFVQRQYPDNVVFTGVITDEEKKYYLQHCDFALNLLENGAGINVKMFEYFAFGIPVITTAYGARGILLTPGKDCIFTESGKYVEDIRKFCNMTLQERDYIAQNALELLNSEYSWRSLGRKVAEEIQNMYGVAISDSMLPLEEIALYDFSKTESYLYQPTGKFYIRCAGKYGQDCLEFVRSMGLEPEAFVDSDDKKINSMVNGVPVISLKQFVEEKNDGEIIVANGLKMFDIAAELLAYGVALDHILLSWYKGRRFLRLSDLKGCRPPYDDVTKWRREIMRRAGEIAKKL